MENKNCRGRVLCKQNHIDQDFSSMGHQRKPTEEIFYIKCTNNSMDNRNVTIQDTPVMNNSYNTWWPSPAILDTIPYIDEEDGEVLTPGGEFSNNYDLMCKINGQCTAAAHVTGNHQYWGKHSTHGKTFSRCSCVKVCRGWGCFSSGLDGLNNGLDGLNNVMPNSANKEDGPSAAGEGAKSLENGHHVSCGNVSVPTGKHLGLEEELITSECSGKLANGSNALKSGQDTYENKAMSDPLELMICSPNEASDHSPITCDRWSDEAQRKSDSNGCNQTYDPIYNRVHNRELVNKTGNGGQRNNEYRELTVTLCCESDNSIEGDSVFEDNSSLDVPCASVETVSASVSRASSSQCQELVDFTAKYFCNHPNESSSKSARKLKGKNTKKVCLPFCVTAIQNVEL